MFSFPNLRMLIKKHKVSQQHKHRIVPSLLRKGLEAQLRLTALREEIKRVTGTFSMKREIKFEE